MCFLLLVCREESSLVCISIKKWTGNQCEQNKFTSRVDWTESPGGWGGSLDIFQLNKKVVFDSALQVLLHFLCWTGFTLTYFLGMPLQSLNDRGAPLHFILIDGTWSNSKAMVSRLQVCLWILVIFWYWIFEKSLISGTDSQILTAMSVNQWVWFPFDYLVDHGSLPEEHSPFSWLAKRSSPWVDRWCSKAATNLCRLCFEFVLNHDRNVDFDTCRSEQMSFGKEVACHV